MALSDGGSALVYSGDTGGPEEFSAHRWTQAGGAQPIAPGVQGTASLMSGDGRVIIGQSVDSSDYRAIIWTEAGGAQPPLRPRDERRRHHGLDVQHAVVDLARRADRKGEPTHVAGVPPDYFSRTGPRFAATSREGAASGHRIP